MIGKLTGEGDEEGAGVQKKALTFSTLNSDFWAVDVQSFFWQCSDKNCDFTLWSNGACIKDNFLPVAMLCVASVLYFFGSDPWPDLDQTRKLECGLFARWIWSLGQAKVIPARDTLRGHVKIKSQTFLPRWRGSGRLNWLFYSSKGKNTSWS